MAVPTPKQVEECVAREWSPNHVQHAALWLGGISKVLRESVSAAGPEADKARNERTIRKAEELELESRLLWQAIEDPDLEIAGDRLSLRACTFLACDSEASLCETLGVPLAVVLAGRSRMYGLAEELIASGSARL